MIRHFIRIPDHIQITQRQHGPPSHDSPWTVCSTTPGRVLPLCWVIWMCRRFDPLFWHSKDWTRSFWGIFLSSTNTKTIFWGIKTTNSYRIRSFRPQISFFPRSFWVQFSAASAAHPRQFSDRVPPRVDNPGFSTLDSSPWHSHPPTCQMLVIITEDTVWETKFLDHSPQNRCFLYASQYSTRPAQNLLPLVSKHKISLTEVR